MLLDLVLSTLGPTALGTTALGQATSITRDSTKSRDVSSYRVCYPPNDDDDDDNTHLAKIMSATSNAYCTQNSHLGPYEGYILDVSLMMRDTS